jgi:ABC-type polysaccharide/polyol phosphate transport system ATPase subunit
MQDNVVLRVADVGKTFSAHDNPADRLRQMIFGGTRKQARTHTALRNISFELRRGETLGIIGRNGAGKSTLLQIVTGTLLPSVGTINVTGRVSAILELGSSINPAFTGRENIPMQCAIQGVPEKEVAAKTATIIEFADLGDFIDQPVRTYSSGMYMRLAFAVAISVDPDILIVDEALSVGDFMFRNRCMRRIQELRAKGVAILFVSHDLGTLQMICDKAIWLENGTIREIGDPVEISQNYSAAMEAPRGADIQAPPLFTSVPQHATEHARFPVFRLRRGEGAVFETGDDIEFDFTLAAALDLADIVLAIAVFRGIDDWVIGQTSRDANVFWPAATAGSVTRGRVTLKQTVLGPGDYGAAIGAYSPDLQICYALTELNIQFKVRTPFTTWGKIIHPIDWEPLGPGTPVSSHPVTQTQS